jgi:hypothetical protein
MKTLVRIADALKSIPFWLENIYRYGVAER